MVRVSALGIHGVSYLDDKWIGLVRRNVGFELLDSCEPELLDWGSVYEAGVRFRYSYILFACAMPYRAFWLCLPILKFPFAWYSRGRIVFDNNVADIFGPSAHYFPLEMGGSYWLSGIEVDAGTRLLYSSNDDLGRLLGVIELTYWLKNFDMAELFAKKLRGVG